MSTLGIVAIGRNEGARLAECLRSVADSQCPVVYVDSGSSDGSPELARTLGADVLELDPARPFSAARARNEGLRRLLSKHPGIQFVQFVDGDCRIASGWLRRGALYLSSHPEVAVVCGRLRERYPERSIYNALCDMEWDQPQGATRTFGGIIVVRVSAFDGVRGFREDVVAGEEPELAIRLRRAGWTSWRLQDEMATHDAGITRFSQWWLRAVRYGHASAQLASLHARSGESSLVRGVASAWVWAAGIPLAACIAWLLGGSAAAALCLAAYPLQVARLALGGNASARRSWSRALFLVIGKFAEAWGQARFAVRDLGGAAPRIIEYK